jgi:hypothetical protein
VATPDEGAAAFKAAAQALNDAADKDLRRQVYAEFRAAARPLGDKVIAEGSAALPHRGGLSIRVSKARMGQSNATTGHNPSIRLNFRVKEGYDLKAMDDGNVTHPVFARPGQPRVWRRQSIRAGAFTTPFEAEVGDVERDILTGLEKVSQEIVVKTRRGSAG